MYILGTYPFIAFKNMISTISHELGIISSKETERMYEYIADRSLNSLYKMFLKFSRPEYAISHYPLLWKRFFTCGDVIVPVAESGHAIIEFHLPDIFLDWLPPACFGYSKKAIELAGGCDLHMDLLMKNHSHGELWNIQYELKWR